MPTKDESGQRRTSVYWIEETTASDGTPQAPTDPTLNLWSKTVQVEGGESSGEYEESIGLGQVVAGDKHHQVESHERTVTYELYRFPEDNSGNVQDPFAFAAKRDIDNQLLSTISLLKVVERDSVVPDNSVHARYFSDLGNTHPGTDPGAESRASRLELYGRGGRPGDVEMSASPGDSAVITVEYPMQFNKVRKYQFDQPDSSNNWIHVRSDDSTDTDVTVTIEETDGSNQEQVTLDSSDAQNAVATSNEFSSVRVHVDDTHSGTIEVYDDDGSVGTSPGAPGILLGYIRGSSDYEGVADDSGVPIIGSNGTIETESAFSGSGISAIKSGGTWDGSAAAQQIMGSTITCANNLEQFQPAGTFAADIKPGQLEAEAECTVYGETESVDKFDDHIYGREGEFVVPTPAGDIAFPRAYVAEGGSTEQEAGTAVMQVEVLFRALEPDSGDPVEFRPA